jgi:hypothetical protein
MSTVFSVTVWIWVAVVATVLLLALYRLVITRGDYTVLHVRRSEVSMIPKQILHDQRLHAVDFWGRWLTVVALIGGLILAAFYIYSTAGEIPRY